MLQVPMFFALFVEMIFQKGLNQDFHKFVANSLPIEIKLFVLLAMMGCEMPVMIGVLNVEAGLIRSIDGFLETQIVLIVKRPVVMP